MHRKGRKEGWEEDETGMKEDWNVTKKGKKNLCPKGREEIKEKEKLNGYQNRPPPLSNSYLFNTSSMGYCF